MIRNVVPPHIGFAFRRYALLVREGLVRDIPDATRAAFREAGMQIVLDLIAQYEPGMDPYEFCSDYEMGLIDECSSSRELCSILRHAERVAERAARSAYANRIRARVQSQQQKPAAPSRAQIEARVATI